MKTSLLNCVGRMVCGLRGLREDVGGMGQKVLSIELVTRVYKILARANTF